MLPSLLVQSAAPIVASSALGQAESRELAAGANVAVRDPLTGGNAEPRCSGSRDGKSYLPGPVPASEFKLLNFLFFLSQSELAWCR